MSVGTQIEVVSEAIRHHIGEKRLELKALGPGLNSLIKGWHSCHLLFVYLYAVSAYVQRASPLLST